MFQFIKFAGVGIANTLVDLGVLNILIIIFSIDKNNNGLYLVAKLISFSCAVINSYLLNRYWVFRNSSSGSSNERNSFITVSVIGLLLNTTFSSLVFWITPHILPNTSGKIIANAAALCGTAVVFIFNFFGYKHFVFRTTVS